MTAAQTLKEARKLIEKGWCQWVFAETSDRTTVDVMDVDACRWCASGAIRHAAKDGCNNLDAYDIFQCVIGTDYVSEWNDAPDRTQAEVLAAFDKAIALAESEATK